MSERLFSNSQISHYRVVSKIGAGGMGEVYLAQDTKLDRKVALKILPADFGDDESRMSRFVREAKSVSALNHPNILTIHEIGEDSSQHYIATEFIAGKTLRELMQAGPLSVVETLDIVCQIGGALNAAHQAGIVHRDIKPENVMVRADGLVKVLDFGLAKLTGGASDPESETRVQSETQPGMIIGTVAYMSPQQARGKTVDARTDVWSLGVVIYEILSGRQPFRGETMTDTLANILHKDPEPLNVEPPDLTQIVDKMLGKKLEARYESINEVVVELKYLQRRIEFEAELDRKSPLNKQTEEKTVLIPSTTSPEPFSRPAIDSASARADEGFWVAVLPFKVRETDSEVSVLADGLSEEIVTGLSRFRYLSVVTNTSAVRLKGNTQDELSVAAKLGTRYVLTGSIRKGGSVIRVSVQLVDTETGAQLWSETYNRDLQTSSIFDVQDDVAGRIVATVADSYGVLVHSMRSAIRKKEDGDLTPAEWQFQYYAYREQISPLAHAALRNRLQRVAEQNLEQSDVWACLAQIYVDEYAFGFEGDATSLDRALAAGRRAVELDRANQFALVALAQVHFFRRDLAAFGPAAERGMALNPLNTDALGILGLQIVHTGQFERGTAIVRRAMELNPNHAGWMHFAPLWNHFHKGEYELALECANRVDVPGHFWPYLAKASACGHLGRRAEAEAAVKDLLALDPEFAAHVRSNVESWHFASGLLEPLLEGLRKAGLAISDEDPMSTSSSRLFSSETRADEGFWVAVLPFKFTGSSSEVRALAEGLSEEVVTGLSRFSYLRVIARNSTLRFTSENADVRLVAQELGARYVMEGSLRQAGTKVRLAVQLVDAQTGAHLWAENYERMFDPESVFELQDDLVPQIVSTVADQYGALVHSISESLRGRSPGEYSAHEAVLRSFGYRERITEEEHAEVRDILEAAIEVAPNHSDCLSALCNQYWHEYAHGYNLRPDPLGRALVAAQRAVAAAPNNHVAHYSLAVVLFFQKDFRAFRPEAERALALNPMDASIVAFIGLMIAYSGDWETGLPVTERAKQLNPNHPGWYYLPFCYDAYRRRDYRAALEIALKVNMPGYFYTHAISAAAYAQLGEPERAHAALRELHKLKPDFGPLAGELLGKWFDAELTEHLLEGLRKAGLAIEDGETERCGDGATERSLSTTRLVTDSPHRSVIYVSSEARADEGFWVAVLPFKFTGASSDLRALAEGLSEDIVTGLSRFSYLRVIARSSSERFTHESADVRLVGQELGARYVMEGSLRQAGKKLRLAVQLIDAVSGAHLWAESFERAFDPDSVFDLQDDLVPRIVSTIAGLNGVLARSMTEVVRSREPDQLSPYEAVLRSFNYFQLVTPEELSAARSCLEMAVAKAPGYVDAWAMLAVLCGQDYGQGFNLSPDSPATALSAARRAVEAGPSNHLAYFSLAQALFFHKEFQSFRDAADRAVTLNPMDGNTLAFVGELLTYVGDSERGLALSGRAKQLNPYHLGWYWYADFFEAYRQRDYRGALSFVRKANLPNHWGMHAGIAASAGQLGESEVAAKALRDLLKLRPNFAANVRKESDKWWDRELVEHFIEGLRKAGLEIEESEAELSDKLQFVADKSYGDRTIKESSDKLKFIGHSPSIAVLPFVNISNDVDNEYFCDGLAEELLNALSKVEALHVAARTSAFAFKGKDIDVREIGQKLNVGTVLEGSVRRSANRLRISAQLVNVADGYQLWSEKYDRKLKDIFDIQDEISLSIVDALEVKLLGEDKAKVTKRYTDNADVHELFLKGRYYSYKYTADGWTRAVEFFEQVIEKHPYHAPAHAGIAAALGCLWFFGLSPAEETVPRFKSAATKAIELDANLAGAHLSLGMVNFFHDWEWEKAEQEFKQAILLNPKDAEALSYYAMFLGFVDRFDEALALARRALEVDPLSLLINMNVGWTYCSAGLANEASDQARRMTEIEPGFFGAYWLKGATQLESGDYEEAIEQLTKAVSLGAHPIVLADLGAAYALAGKRETAESILDQLLDMRRQSYVSAICLARVYSRLGELEKTIQWLETAYEERNGELVFLENEITGAAKGDSLHSLGKDPRVMDLLERIKLPSRGTSRDEESK